MTTTQVSCTRPQTSGRPRAWHYIGLGSLCGLAWAAGLRGFMARVAGSWAEVEWAGTFAWILAPGVATGAMLGLAEWLRRTGDDGAGAGSPPAPARPADARTE